MASDECWGKLKHFKKDSTIDNWGDPNAINEDLLYRLDDFRTWVGSPILVTSGVRNQKLGSKSFHTRENGALAVDVVIPKYENSAFDLVLDATRFGFRGIGFYPHWRYKGEIVGGLHLDMRPLKWEKDLTLNYRHSRWMGILGADGKQRYIDLNIVNLMKYAIDDLGLLNDPWIN